MKKKFTITKSLSFQKETIAKLDQQQLNQVYGGAVVKQTNTDPRCSCEMMTCNHTTESCFPPPTETPFENL